MSDVYEKDLTTELRELQFATYPEIFSKFKELSNKYGNMPVNNLINAFGAVNNFGSMYTPNPYVQNQRVKAISSLPRNFTKDQVGDMIKAPDANEQPLREIAHALEYTAYPLFHVRTVYQNLLTYHNYTAPYLIDKEDTDKPEFWREWKLIEKLRTEFNIRANAHQIAGQAMQEGKVFYYPRYKVDKSHNKVEHAFMQQLPSDWVKIVGFNNKSKYTIAFNLMYFTQYGTDIRQFGDLLTPYINDFYQVITPAPKLQNGKIVYASNTGLKLNEVNKDDSNIEAYCQNGRWYYWVTLPVDKVFTFEIDDAGRNAVSPFTGLFIDLIQLSQLEQIQLELLQNPLISVLTGEIPYWSDSATNTADRYKISDAGRKMFESLWYQMMAFNNTSGIGFYAAPFENITLHQLSEAPSAMDIVSKGYTDTMAKAGLPAIIPVQADSRAGAVQVSLQIESRFAQTIYLCFERMMNCIIGNLNLKFDWRFHMFGSLATDAEDEKSCRNDLTLGILPATLRYLALKDMSIFEDISTSSAIKNSGLLDLRLPLITSYTSKNEGNALPPNDNGGGRPPSDGVTSEGHEGDIDSAGGLA